MATVLGILVIVLLILVIGMLETLQATTGRLERLLHQQAGAWEDEA